MSTTLTNMTAAEALAAALPSAAEITVTPHPDRAGLAAKAPKGGMGGSFVGSVSADLAAFIEGVSDLALEASEDETRVNIADMYRPAFDAAATVFGNGVVGSIARTEVGELLADEGTELFELTAGGRAVGWIAIRVREEATRSIRAGVSEKLGRISDVEMALTVEIGRTRMSVRDVLNLEPGGVIELDRSAGSPADVLLNGRLIARGEVVVVDQDYAVRITKILDVPEGLS